MIRLLKLNIVVDPTGKEPGHSGRNLELVDAQDGLYCTGTKVYSYVTHSEYILCALSSRYSTNSVQVTH